MSILLFSLPCWSLAIQNVGIHYVGVHKITEGVLPYFDWEVANNIFHAHLIMMIYTIPCICCTVECFVTDLLGSHHNPICCLGEQHFLGLNLKWQVLQFYCLAKQCLPSLCCHLGMICKHHDHSARFTNTLCKIFLIHSSCPIAICLQASKTFNNRTDVNRLSK